jgi:spore germination protein GerM
MHNPSPRRSLPWGLVAGFALLLLTTGSAVAWWSWQSIANRPQAATEATPSATGFAASGGSVPTPSPNPSSSSSSATKAPTEAPATTGGMVGSSQLPAASNEPQTYWLKDDGTKTALVPSPVTEAGNATATQPGEKAEVALKTLLSGANPNGATTSIPKDTKLRSVTVKPDGIHVDLSEDFVSGGGSSSMTARVGQVLYTVTSEDPDAQVWFSVEGKPVQSLGGEGLELDGPLTRKDFEKDFGL